MASTRFGDGNSLTNSYNAENRLSGVRLPSGVALTNFYDFAGRLTNRNSSIGETAGFEYNGNDAVTKMTDNTGSTTNIYDAAGRLATIAYPSGARVDYAYDLLDRIAAITNKASTGGTAYVTRYEYDPIGNVTNVIDPFNGSTKFEHDRVGRRTRRVLPNNVVTEWQYDWRDRVTNLTHKTSGGTEIARVRYERTAGGEPTKLLRDDNGSHSYVVLNYDASWRLQSEAHYAGGANGSGGTLSETINYTYDASGNRTKVVNASGTFTNGIASGYRLVAVTNTSTGLAVENYGYDLGGRMTNMVRSGQNFTLGYNSADQVSQVIVTNGGATFHDYEYDGAGRRTRAKVNGAVTRKFLVAPTPGYDLESPLLVADGGNNFQMGYVYVDGRPTQRYASSGSANTVYYLEDGMGSVIGLVDASQSSVAVFKYDGFGQTRSATGSQASPPSSAGGDFRFHGGWLESATTLYHFRARDYDPHTGRFTSRDPAEGEFKHVETFLPYAFANNNAFVYSDPSGQFTLIEINLTTLIQAIEKLGEAGAGAVARRSIIKRIGKWTARQMVDYLQTILPIDEALINALGVDDLQAGREFQRMAEKLICTYLPIPSGWLWLEPRVRGRVVAGGAFRPGDVFSNGIGCGERETAKRLGGNIPRPDFIISPGTPRHEDGTTRKGLLIGEFKLSGKSFINAYGLDGTKAKQQGQWNAITGYASEHTYTRIALFISLRGMTPPIRNQIIKAGLKNPNGKVLILPVGILK